MIVDTVKSESPLNAEEKAERILSMMGIVRALVAKRLPDNFNVTIKVRARTFRRMEIQPVVEETVIEPRGLMIT